MVFRWNPSPHSVPQADRPTCQYEDERASTELPEPKQIVSLWALCGGYLAPGFIDLHVYGGAGHDCMDGTDAASPVNQADFEHARPRRIEDFVAKV
jgi:N-acetylglucosamine-6-phosphate deacetylase